MMVGVFIIGAVVALIVCTVLVFIATMGAVLLCKWVSKLIKDLNDE